MKRISFILFMLSAATALWAQTGEKKTLYVYDEVNEQSTPYIAVFKAAFAERGIAYDEATAADLESRDLGPYDRLVIHGMYMAFNMKSPVRDWLKDRPNLDGKEVSLLVTSNMSKAEKLSSRLVKLLKKADANVVDAVSMATKEMDEAEKKAAVAERVGRLK